MRKLQITPIKFSKNTYDKYAPICVWQFEHS